MYRLNKTFLLAAVAAVITVLPIAYASDAHASNDSTIKALFSKSSSSETPRNQANQRRQQIPDKTQAILNPGKTDTGGSVAAIARLQTETALLKAKIALLELRLKQAKLQGELTDGSPGINSDAKFNAPQVVSVYGTPGHLESQLQYGDNTVINVKQGAIIPGGAHVVSITARSVVIVYRGHRIPLAFAGGAPAAPLVLGSWQPPKILPRNKGGL